LIKGVTHKGVDPLYASWRKVLAGFVAAKQETVSFGRDVAGCGSDAFDEIEVDESVFRKTALPDNQVEFHEYVGAKRRGDRQSLHLAKRAGARSRSTRTRNGKAAPPPMTVEEWEQTSAALVGEGTLVHADGAPAYKKNKPGIKQDAVNHSTRNGGPFYTKPTTHLLPSGERYKAQGGTQSMDSIWGWAKKNMHGVHAGNAKKIDERVREFQWRHWLGDKDRWVAAGEVLSWVPE